MLLTDGEYWNIAFREYWNVAYKVCHRAPAQQPACVDCLTVTMSGTERIASRNYYLLPLLLLPLLLP